MTSEQAASVFVVDGDWFVPTVLARGPWNPNAQHGGAPSALLAHVAQNTVADDAFMLARLTVELLRPVPIAPLRVSAQTGRGRNVRRVELVIEHDGKPVTQATALFLRRIEMQAPAPTPHRLAPLPDDCTERFASPGLARTADTASFGSKAMEVRIAHGSSLQPGPAAAWLRLRLPLVAAAPTTPAMRTMAAADFGNGTSWVLSAEDYMFMNTDLTVYWQREPQGEWIGLDSETIATAQGLGLTTSTLYDVHGRIGTAHQNLLMRQR